MECFWQHLCKKQNGSQQLCEQGSLSGTHHCVHLVHQHFWHHVDLRLLCVSVVQVKVMKRVRDIREQLLGLMDRTEIELTSNLGDHDAIKKAIAAGFFYNTARLRKDGAYRTIKNPQTIHIHPSSGLTKMEVSCLSLLYNHVLCSYVLCCA